MGKPKTAKLIRAFLFATRIVQFIYFRKPKKCLGEIKDADQICDNCEADQRLCFRNTDSTINLLSKSKIPSLYQSSVTVQPGL